MSMSEIGTEYLITTQTGSYKIAEIETKQERQGLHHVFFLIINGQRISEHRFMDCNGKPGLHLVSKQFAINIDESDFKPIYEPNHENLKHEV